MLTRDARRLERMFDRLKRRFPIAGGFVDWVRKPSSRLVRFPLGILLVLGGIFSILPVLGIWMLPLGLLMLAIDLPFLQKPLTGMVLRVGRWWELRRRRHRDRRLQKVS